ncbi:MAG: hypothetical protein AAF560_23610 [Acidobacteriota bacterium]
MSEVRRWLESQWLLLATATLAGALLRLAIAPHFDFFGDELFTLEWCQRSVSEILTSFHPGITMHLYLLWMKLWSAVAGTSPLAMKLPSLIAGVALIPSVAWLGWRWLGAPSSSSAGADGAGADAAAPRLDGRTAAVMVALVVASSPLIHYSRTARVYAILVLGTVFSMMLFAQAMKTGSKRVLVGSSLLNAALMAMSLHAVYVLLVQAVSAVIESLGPARRGFRWLVAVAASQVMTGVLSLAFYAMALPKIIGQFSDSSITTTASYMVTQPLAYRPKFFLQLWLPFSWNHTAWPGVMLVLMLVGAGLAIWRLGFPGRLLVVWATVPPLFYFIVPFGFVPDSIARYLVPVVVAQLALVAVALTQPLRWLPRTERWPTLVFFLAAMAFTMSHGWTRQQLFLQSEPSARTLRHLVNIVQPGDLVTSYPGHHDALIAESASLEASALADLVNAPRMARPGRLLIVLREVPEGLGWWLRYFEGFEVRGPGYVHRFYVLISPRLVAGPDALVEPLRHFYYGFLHIMAEEGRLHRYGSFGFDQLRRVHRRLGRLALQAGDEAEHAEHVRLSRNPRAWLGEDFDAPRVMKVLSQAEAADLEALQDRAQ